VPGAQTRTFHAAALAQLSFFWSATGLPGARPELVSSVRGGRYGMLRAALARVLKVPRGKVESTDVMDLDGEVTWAKARRLTPATYQAAAKAAHRSRGQGPDVVAAALKRYEADKRAAALLDFDDLLEQCAHLIETDVPVATQVRSQYVSFVVDEYQDTDPAQQRLLDAWLGTRDDITVVGDVFQTIYSFKGAEPALLTDFAARFPHATTVRLVRDYRSTPQVVNLANTLMADVDGPGVVLLGQRPDGPAPAVRQYDTEAAEEADIAARVAALLAAGTSGGQIAVLHRFNSQAVRLEAALRDAGIEVTSGSGEPFFGRPEIKAALVALELCAASTPGAPGAAALTEALTQGGFDPKAAPTGQGAARSRYEAQGALADLARSLPAPVRATAQALADELVRRSMAETAPHGADAVTVCTIHKAKGLEWDAVLVPRLTMGSLPSVFATTPAELAEERRLLYVAATRARTILELSSARTRGDGWGRLQTSPFLNGLAGQGAGRARSRQPSTGSRPVRGGPGGDRMDRRPKTVKRPTAEEIEAGRSPTGGFKRAQLATWGVPWPPPKGWRARLLRPGAVIKQPTRPGCNRPPSSAASAFAPGQRVTHDKHGMGLVTAVSPSSVKVDFGGPRGAVAVKMPTSLMQAL
jgi:DNA helicase-2/ATP-dependent DNA helicase PcrA